MNLNTVGDVIEWSVANDKEVDFYTDYTDEYEYPTWVGAYLTPEGKKRFAKVLALPVKYDPKYDSCEVLVSKEGPWDPEEMELRLYTFLNMAAGYGVSVDDFGKYFTIKNPKDITPFNECDKRICEEEEWVEHEWDDFSKDFPNSDKYLPRRGDGDNMGTQASTALCKLVYKWFNDGDVFDNTGHLTGWVNDISGSANWLYNHIPETRKVLERVWKIKEDDDYTELLYDLCKIVDPMIPDLLNKEKDGNAYDDHGPFSFAKRCSECGVVLTDRNRDSLSDMCKDCAEEQEED